MKKSIGIKTIFITLILLCSLNSVLESKKLEMNFDLGILQTKSQINTGALWNWNTDFVDISEDISILNNKKDISLGFAGGIRLMIKENFGFFLSAAYLNQRIDSDSDYLLQYTWYDGEQGELDRNWHSGDGKITSTPYTIGLIFRKPISSSSSIVLKGGISIAPTKTKLYGTFGFAEAYETDLEYKLNWYALDIEINESETLIGGNIAFEYETRFAQSFDFYVGVEYYFFPSKTYKWNVTTEEYYNSDDQIMYEIDSNIIHDVDGDIINKIEFSTIRIYTGIRYYF